VVVVAVLACLLVPAAAVVGARRNRVLRWLSPVVLCYVAGIVLGNVGAVPPV
jgi:mannose/fructose/N-acetylgalactosamine-specific phosphotransferase system component IIC